MSRHTTDADRYQSSSFVMYHLSVIFVYKIQMIQRHGAVENYIKIVSLVDDGNGINDSFTFLAMRRGGKMIQRIHRR